MKKANPDVVIRYAVKIVDDQDRKTFYAAMRAEFPRITSYMLRKMYQDAKIIRAIQHVYSQRAHQDES